MSALPSFRLGAGHDVAYSSASELEGIVWYEVFKCDSRYTVTQEPGSIRPQRLVTLKFVPPGTPQDDIRNFFGTPNGGTSVGQHSRWTIWIRRKVSTVNVDVSYNVEIMDTTLHSELVSAVEQQYYLVTFGMTSSDITAAIAAKR